MIGLDSVSRLGFHRQLTTTREFLLDPLSAVEMMGYNKVGDNTLLNMVPLLNGKFNSELADQTFDDLIWKQFSENGYRTFYAEDYPAVNAFDSHRRGLGKPPTDYFYRPLANAMESMKTAWYNKKHCFQDRLEMQIVFDYLYNFVSTYRHEPHFALTFITRPTHDDVNGAGHVDYYVHDLIQRLHDDNLLSNTVFILFSDHGMRYGLFRYTYVGKLEDRLPLMAISVPKRLTQKHVYVKNSLRVNQHRLSTNFDIYETLKEILYFTGIQKKTVDNSTGHRGISLFREIPINRPCDQADIHPHWCTCARYEALETSHIHAKHISDLILSNLAQELTNFTDICEELYLLQIKEAFTLVRPRTVGDYEDIQVVIETTPGNAVFEATFRADSTVGTYTIGGDISRINGYGHQADCMRTAPRHGRLQRFCMCRPGLG